MKKYQPAAIEEKWQKHWEERKTFKAEMDPAKPKYYILDMFPYPSGAGLHVGHLVGYTATDAIARYKRQKGFNVLHPMAWDSFGLPAEQYAIRTGTHPGKTTEENIGNFRRQLKKVGYSYDWDREFATSDSSYYKWTQWIFTKLYERGLAYEAEMLVNYCPELGTVLSNEEVENGLSVLGGHPVVRRPLKQWILKITEYADRLLDDLKDLDWPEHLKRLQRNWIGRSEGAHVDFQEPESGEKIRVFTTRADTLFGCSYMVLAPEHPLVKKLTRPERMEAVQAYLDAAASKSDLERAELSKEKTGVDTGATVINPVNGEAIPLWVADYVLMGYGTGAVMAVPAHDERDFEFAEKYGLSVKPVFDPDVKEGEGDASPEEVREQVLAGKRCWTGDGTVINRESKKFNLNGMDKVAAIKAATAWIEENGHGKRAVTYKLRDWLFSRQRYWGEPFPILHFEDGSKRVLDLDELPLEPPEVADYLPAGDGKSPLAKVPEWVDVVDPKTGKKAKRETNTMPQWAGSCWYYLRMCDPQNNDAAWSPEAEKYWMPVDLYIGGTEHAVLHLLYARFWHKVLYDCGLVSTKEPFQSLRNQGMLNAPSFKIPGGPYVETENVEKRGGEFIDRESGKKLLKQMEKMGKSKLNGVNPDDVSAEHGTDALRTYELFMGPMEKEKLWSSDAISGCSRFLSRFFDLVNSEKLTEESDEAALKLGHRLVDGAVRDYEGLQFNTVIAKLMTFVNDFSKLKAYPKDVLLMAIQVLNPLAPHLAEECWEILGGAGDLSYAPFPEADEKYLKDDSTTYVVQINGKVRARMELPMGQTQDVVLAEAEGNPNVQKFLNGSEIKKVIFVPNKLLNLVVAKG